MKLLASALDLSCQLQQEAQEEEEEGSREEEEDVGRAIEHLYQTSPPTTSVANDDTNWEGRSPYSALTVRVR